MALEAEYRLETPEQIELRFDLAGPGSRFCAILLDWLILFACSLILVLLFMAAFSVSFGALVFADNGETVKPIAQTLIALLVLLMGFLFVSGYYIMFEMLMGGQTPGKKRMCLRVIGDDGTPLTFVASAIRNLLRIVDFLPSFYLVGVLVSMFHPEHKRLGDWAAGTIVVKESAVEYQAQPDRRERVGDPPTSLSDDILDQRERQMLQQFFQRREHLTAEARRSLALQLTRRFYPKHGGHVDKPELYLERIWEGRTSDEH